MNKEQIFEKFKDVLVSLGFDSVFLNRKFKDDLGVDSLDIVEIVMHTESSFNITIADEELDNIVTVEDAVNVILKHLNL